MNSHKATLISSQAYAKSNKKEILNAFVTLSPPLNNAIPSAIE